MRQRTRFSLRALMVGTAICGAILLPFVHRLTKARYRRAAVVEIQAIGADVEYDFQDPRWVRFLLPAALERSEVRYVAMSARSSTDDQTVEICNRFPHLRTFIAPWRGSRITDEGARALAQMRELQGVDIPNCHITDEGAAELSSLPHLGRLDLTGNDITDAGVAHLAQCSELQVLGLCGTDISDNALSHLSSLNQLERIELEGTKVSQAAIDSFHRLNPNCQVNK